MNALLLDTPTLDALPAVSLADLNATAEFLTRVDRKYLLTPQEADAFVAALPSGTRALEIDGLRSFGYSSTYYDTVGLDCFLDTARRRPRRGKVRSRTYLDSGQIFLEVKTRSRAATVKTRIAWPQQVFDPAARGFINEMLARGGVGLDGALRPVLDVQYQRSTLLLPGGEARLTLDSDLSYTLAEGDRTWRAEGLVIVETKSGSKSSSADRLLWRLGHRPANLSKYATGLAALMPELPRNRWHRLLHSAPFADAA